jgi:hypothetical protein
MLLPKKTTPELLYLQTKWAALASYGMTVKMFEDVLPVIIIGARSPGDVGS